MKQLQKNAKVDAISVRDVSKAMRVSGKVRLGAIRDEDKMYSG